MWGKVLTAPSKLPSSGEHPHSRGEKSYNSLRRIQILGTTPTRMGKRHEWMKPGCHPREHPHSRGEKHMTTAVIAFCPGPPPMHVGKNLQQPAAVLNFKEHSTHCGEKSREPSLYVAGEGTPPLTRGEKSSQNRIKTGNLGPPPRMWGKAWHIHHRKDTAREHPTHVGKRQRDDRDHLQQREHPPRMLGKYERKCQGWARDMEHPHVSGEK